MFTLKIRDTNPFPSQSWTKIFKGGTKGQFSYTIYNKPENQRGN
jgi:hypothetical protein